MSSILYSQLSASIAQLEQEADRFELRGYLGGYRIYDNGELISTIHGPNFKLASRLYRMLRDDAEREQ